MDVGALDIFELEGAVAIAAAPVGLAAYDFAFRDAFACRSVVYGTELPVLARVGAIDDYNAFHADLVGAGLRPLHDQAQHARAASLCGWEPRIRGLTPETLVADALPPAAEVGERFGWPVFLKGDRQTSRHRAELSIARDPADYERIRTAWATDPILHWQRAAVRRFVPLRRVGDHPSGLQASYEFRVFCWHGRVVGLGPYWTSQKYAADARDEDAIRALATRAAGLVDVPFLVVDVAQTAAGDWTVIECNDGQESSYAGVLPLAVWRGVVDAARPG